MEDGKMEEKERERERMGEAKDQRREMGTGEIIESGRCETKQARSLPGWVVEKERGEREREKEREKRRPDGRIGEIEVEAV